MTTTQLVDDAKLTPRAIKRDNIMNPVVVARDGVGAFDVLFVRGVYAERAGKPPPPERNSA